MPITSSDGDQVYCNLVDDAPRSKKGRQDSRRTGRLLSSPIDVLMDEADQDAYLKAVAASTVRQESPNQVAPLHTALSLSSSV